MPTRRPIPKQVLRSVLAAIWLRPGKVRRCLFGPYAGTRYHISPQISERLGLFFRPYERPVTDYLRKKLKPDMVVYDVGAHVGIHAVYAARLVGPGGHVYAFEAWPANYDELIKHIELNKLNNIHPVKRIVADTLEPLALTAGHTTSGTHHITKQDETASVNGEATTLDEHWRTTGHAPSLILIDVEGEEERVLKGAAAVLKHATPIVVIEYHDTEALAALTDFLGQFGYGTFRNDRRHLYATR